MTCGALAAIILHAVLLAAPETAKAQDEFVPVTETHFGRKLSSISFYTGLNLGYEDLIDSVVFAPGDTLTVEGLAASERNLAERKVFSRIEPRVKEDSGSLALRFFLEPLVFISEVQFHGNQKLDYRKLQRLAAVRYEEPLTAQALHEAEVRIGEGYRELGYRRTSVRAGVSPRRGTPNLVLAVFNIDEGYLARISRLDISGLPPEEAPGILDRLRADWPGRSASEANIKKIRQRILLELRRKGYLQASVELPVLTDQELSGDVDLLFRAVPRDAVSLKFQGNTVFSSAELAAPLRMQQRTVPLGPNAIKTLVREVRELYQEYGYYFTKVRLKEFEAEQGRKGYLIEIAESAQYRLAEIRFSGNEAFSSKTLRQIVGAEKHGWWLFRRWQPGFLVKKQIRLDCQAIEDYYESRSYLGSKVDYEVTADEERKTLVLEFRISEAPRQYVRAVDLVWLGAGFANHGSGDDRADFALAGIAPAVRSGDWLSTKELEEQRVLLQREILHRGYPNADVSLETDAENGIVRFVVQPGLRIRVGRIILQGNTFTHDSVIRRELKLRSGDLWQTGKVEESQNAVNGLGFFRTVSLGPADGMLDSAVEDLAVFVQERDTASAELDLGYNTEDGLRAGASVAQRNWSGNGAAIVAGFDAYIRPNEGDIVDAVNANVAVARPRFLDSRVDVSLEAFAQSSLQLVEEYSYDRVGGASVARYRIAGDLHGASGIRAYHENLSDVEADMIIGPDDDGRTFYAFLFSDISWDRRDNPLNPRKGHRSSLEVRAASGAFGSEADLAGFTAQESVYSPLNERWTWANNARLRLMEPFGDTNVVPLGQRFFLGGRNSLRGFSRNVIGPRGNELNIAGGDTSLNLSTELRYAFTETVSGLLFFDAGQSILRHEGSFTGDPLTFGDMRYSPGFGLHYQTPIGPITTEVGFGLDREYGERWGRIYIGIGNAF